MSAAQDYSEYLEFAIKLGREAALMIQEGSKERFEEDAGNGSKSNAVDLVTATDVAVEAHILNSIKAKYPNHAFIGEEATSAGGSTDLNEADKRGNGWVWIVDPIDGTTNFVHTSPDVGSSIGLMHNRNPVVGVIVMPFWPSHHQLFYGSMGCGTFVSNLEGGQDAGVRLPKGGKARSLDGLSGCMVITDFASDRRPKILSIRSQNIINLLGKGPGQKMVRALRINGASTTSICSILLGQADLNYDAGPWAWDMCAGAIMLKEAGALFVGGKDSFARGTDTMGEIVMARRYAMVRPVAATETETSDQIQRRIVTELYGVIEEWRTQTMIDTGAI